MAILGALSIARSGLLATGEALSVTGNNIANVNTIAFKGSRAEFADLLAARAGGGAIGLGTRLAGVDPSFAQGAIESTGRATDLAIEGNGFFIVRDGDGNLYTRAGNFRLSADGVLVTQQGLPLQGFEVDDLNQPVGALTDVAFDGATSQPEATTAVAVKNNLDAGATLIAGGFDATDWETASATSNVTTTTKVYDSLGVSHDVTLFFTRTGANAWDVNVGVDAGETGGTPGELAILGTVALTFNPDGSLAGPDPTDVTVTFSGADAQTISFDFGTPNTGPTPGEGLDGVTQFGSASTVSAEANGFAAGQIEAIVVSADGLLTGVFDNGQSRALYRLALADFAAPDGLTALGSGLYRESIDSGAATVSTPGAGGLGSIVASAVERSNVDLAQEFVDLISLQRSFQANARVITTSDGLLNDLINVVR
ncbi:MAG: flagellar hook protein FlgE [Thermodesulfobacteriota bacterium]